MSATPPGVAEPTRATDGSPRLHVMMVTDFYWPHLGGVEQHVRNLAHVLVDRGHRVSVVTVRTDDLAAAEFDGGVEVHRIRTAAQRVPALFDQRRPWSPPVPDPLARRSIASLVRRLEPDIVHGHDWLARSAPSGVGWPPRLTSLHYYTLSCARKDLLRMGHPCDGPALAKCVACSVEHYGPLRGPVVAVGAAIGRRRERRRTDHFIAVSRATATGNQIDPDSTAVSIVPNFLPAESTRSGPSDELVDDLVAHLPPDGFFVYVGDLRSAKGYDLLLEAYGDLATDRPLVVIGKRWAATPDQVPSGVLVVEDWPNAAVLHAFERGGIAVVPSQWAEPFGIVAIEAMRGGCPVIASDVGGLAEVVSDGRTGLLVPVGDVRALRDAMALLDRDEELRARMGTAARADAASYEAHRVVADVERVYAELLAP